MRALFALVLLQLPSLVLAMDLLNISNKKYSTSGFTCLYCSTSWFNHVFLNLEFEIM